jgi:hypothetical protein
LIIMTFARAQIGWTPSVGALKEARTTGILSTLIILRTPETARLTSTFL